MTKKPDTERCKKRVWGEYGSAPCSRKAKRDGYCTQHHPDAKAERDAKREAEWAKERARTGWLHERASLLKAVADTAIKAHRRGDTLPEDLRLACAALSAHEANRPEGAL